MIAELNKTNSLTTAAVVAKRLGVAPWRVYELARDGLLPTVRVGRSMRFDPDAIERFIANGGTLNRGPGA